MNLIEETRGIAALGVAHATRWMTRVRRCGQSLGKQVARDRGFYGQAQLVVVHGAGTGDNSVALRIEDATSIGVDNKDGMPTGVEQDGISSLATYAFEAEQLSAKFSGGLGEHTSERAAIMRVKEADEDLQAPSLLAEETGRV